MDLSAGLNAYVSILRYTRSLCIAGAAALFDNARFFTVTQHHGPIWLEINPWVSLFGDNVTYQGDSKLEQKPLYVIEDH